MTKDERALDRTKCLKLNVFSMVIAVVTFCGVIASIVYSPGRVNGEGLLGIVNHLLDYSLIRIIFEPWVNDVAGLFRARELSYVFDLLDTWFVRWGFELKVPKIVSVVHYFSMFTILMLHSYYSKRTFGRAGLLTILLPNLLFLTDPESVFGIFLRTAKSVTAVALMFLFWQSYLAWRDDVNAPAAPSLFASRRRFLIFFLSGLVACLLDEQGVYFTCLTGGMLGIAYLIWRGRNALVAGVGLIAAVGSAVGYRYLIGRKLIAWVTGEVPMAPWSIGLGYLFRHFQEPIGPSANTELNHLSYLFGNSRIIAVLVALFVCIYPFVLFLDHRRAGKDVRVPLYSALVGVIGLFSVFVLYVLCFSRLPESIVSPHWSRVFYGLPATAFFFFGTTLAVHAVIARWGIRAERGFQAAAAIMVLMNLFALPEHRAKIENVYYTGALSCLYDPERKDVASYGVDPLEMTFCARMRKRLDGQFDQEIWRLP